MKKNTQFATLQYVFSGFYRFLRKRFKKHLAVHVLTEAFPKVPYISSRSNLAVKGDKKQRVYGTIPTASDSNMKFSIHGFQVKYRSTDLVKQRV
jgi:hypothetical protein